MVIRLLTEHAWLSHHFTMLIINIDEGPSLNSLHSASIWLLLDLGVLEYLSLVLFWALKLAVLPLECVDRVSWRWHVKSSVLHEVPVDISKEGMLLDFLCSCSTSSKSLAWIPIQEMHDQILCLWRHTDGKFENSSLDVVEEL